MGRPLYHLAYVFERFPSFTQTFCAREVAALRRAGVRPAVYSIRDTSGEEYPCPVADEVADLVHVLPQGKDLVAEVKALKDADLLPQRVVLTLRHWGGRPDKQRVYEAAYIGYQLRRAGVSHVHAHFAGVGARACWWIRFFYGMSYSFTGHANDLFCDQGDVGVGLDALVADAAAVVTVSEFTARWLHERFPDDAWKIVRVYNGLDLSPFAAIASDRFAGGGERKDRSGIQILSVGRLIEKKGFPELIDACGLLRDSGVSFRCQIIGDGPLAGQLASKVERLGLGSQVELAGACSVDEVRSHLAAADVFALACTTEADGGMDNLPTVLMEAMAAGLPCVSTMLAGVPEMVVDGETGLLSEPGDAVAFARALETLAGDPALRTRMGHAGMARSLSIFDQARTAGDLLRTLVRLGRIPYDGQLTGAVPGLRGAYFSQKLRRTGSFFHPARFHPGASVPPEALLK